MSTQLDNALAMVEAAQKEQMSKVAGALKVTADLIDSDETKRLFPQGLPPNLEQIKQYCAYQSSTLTP